MMIYMMMVAMVAMMVMVMMMMVMMVMAMMVMVMMVWICGQDRGGIRISFQLLVQLHLSTNPNLQRS